MLNNFPIPFFFLHKTKLPILPVNIGYSSSRLLATFNVCLSPLFPDNPYFKMVKIAEIGRASCRERV